VEPPRRRAKIAATSPRPDITAVQAQTKEDHQARGGNTATGAQRPANRESATSRSYLVAQASSEIHPPDSSICPGVRTGIKTNLARRATDITREPADLQQFDLQLSETGAKIFNPPHKPKYTGRHGGCLARTAAPKNIGYILIAMSNCHIPRRAAIRIAMSALVAPSPSRAEPVDQTVLLPQPGDLLVVGTHQPEAGTIIDPARLIQGGPPVFARVMDPITRSVRNHSRNSQILLLRLATDDHGTSNEIVGFSAICTHAGCVVSGWKPEQRALFCPCHGSVYDPAESGRVIGGPAPRPLPALPLRPSRNELTVTAPFTGKIGGYTGRTD
jgi:rieske iron-sulfur protein